MEGAKVATDEYPRLAHGIEAPLVEVDATAVYWQARSPTAAACASSSACTTGSGAPTPVRPALRSSSSASTSHWATTWPSSLVATTFRRSCRIWPWELLFPAAARLAPAPARCGRRASTRRRVTRGSWARLRRPAGRTRLVTRSHGLEHGYWEATLAEARAEGSSCALRTQAVPRRLAAAGGGGVAARLGRRAFSNRPDLDYAVSGCGSRATERPSCSNGLPPEFQDLEFRPADDRGGVAVIGTWASRKGSRYGWRRRSAQCWSAARTASGAARHRCPRPRGPPGLSGAG